MKTRELFIKRAPIDILQTIQERGIKFYGGSFCIRKLLENNTDVHCSIYGCKRCLESFTNCEMDDKASQN